MGSHTEELLQYSKSGTIWQSALKLRLKQFNLGRHGVAYDEGIAHERISNLLEAPRAVTRALIEGCIFIFHVLPDEFLFKSVDCHKG